MNRNSETIFNLIPSTAIQRSKFDIPHKKLLTGNVGMLYPWYVSEVLPGDTVQMKTSKVVRLQTLLSPIMDDLVCDVSWFFVPNRLVFDNWKNLMGENSGSAWIPEQSYVSPKMLISMKDSSTTVPKGSILDYMGVPVGLDLASMDKLTHMPVRAYHLIWDTFWRDENLQDPIDVYKGTATKTLSDKDADENTSQWIYPRPACKTHDAFTSALPGPQKGPDVLVPALKNSVYPVGPMVANHDPLETYKPTGSETAYPVPMGMNKGASPTGDGYAITRQESGTHYGIFSTTYNTSYSADVMYPTNLYAKIGTAAFSTINELRLAFQIQRLYETDARSGTRYQEIIASHFKTRSPDARLQRPEYLGGNRISLNVSEVTNSAQSSGEFLGDLGAKSHTVDIHADFVHSFTEHGYLIGLLVVRQAHHSYPQGLERLWTRSTRFDWYWPTLAHIGEQPVPEYCLYADADHMDDVFGYQEAWWEYRHKPDSCAGEMRPGLNYGFDSWTLADSYAEAPTLSDGWIRETATNTDRVLAVTSAAADQFFADIYCDSTWTRPMPLRSVPGLIDHF